MQTKIQNIMLLHNSNGEAITGVSYSVNLSSTGIVTLAEIRNAYDYKRDSFITDESFIKSAYIEQLCMDHMATEDWKKIAKIKSIQWPTLPLLQMAKLNEDESREQSEESEAIRMNEYFEYSNDENY